MSTVLKASGLHTVAHCVQVWIQSIAKWVVERPIFEMYQGVVKARNHALPILMGSANGPRQGEGGSLSNEGLDGG